MRHTSPIHTAAQILAPMIQAKPAVHAPPIAQAVQVHYPGDTYKALNDAKRVSKVAAWLKNAEINLGPVQLPDGSEIERVIEPWVPKKQVKAYNPRQALPGMQSTTLV